METILVVSNDDEVQDGRVEGTSGVMQVQEERYHNDNSYFPKLSTLWFHDLPNLKSISKPAFPLLFPSLKQLEVIDCPNLENICLGRDSAEDTMEIIYEEQEWWDRLKWEDEETKATFLPRSWLQVWGETKKDEQGIEYPIPKLIKTQDLSKSRIHTPAVVNG
jgi:hypothetical protein